ncbi:MAG: bifunctional transaldolase/phosoglucose isomerase [Dehalococcoidales bacterium]
MMNPIQKAQSLGQGMWIDYMRRGLLSSGEFQRMIEQGISGVTSNPTIFEKAIVGSTDYDEALRRLGQAGKSATEIYETLAIEDIRTAADLLRPVYDRTGGADGYACLECNPTLAYDTEGTIAEARRLFAALNRPNIMIKVPATAEGIPAIRRLIAAGLNINVTLIFSLDMYRQVSEAYISGLEELGRDGGDISSVSSVASFFLSRIDVAVDSLLEARIRQGRKELTELLGKTAIASAKIAYRSFRQTLRGERFKILPAKGAHVQRPLWASTSTKNPAYRDVLYIESLIGADTVNTMPPATIAAFLEHGRTEATLERDVPEAERFLESLVSVDINIEQVTAKLLSDGVKLFTDSFEKLLAGIEEKKARLLEPGRERISVSLGTHLSAVEETLNKLEKQNIVGRIWRKDHTVWKPDPGEITNRLGWLTVTDLMSEQVPALAAFAEEVRNDGFRNVVLLGMGGASLGTEVLRRTFGSTAGYPELTVLDSTVPSWVQSVTDAIDPAHTLFLVSSKSGGTVETLTFYKYFRNLVESSIGKERAGKNFVAITDSGTSLARLAEEAGFRRVFLNLSDIGGRYSVLSYFGLVPAALMGIDIARLIDLTDGMREGCASCVPAKENRGAWLGATLSTLARQGRDKLTLVTSPSLNSFGLWVEQLIAESLGKDGKGIIPIMGEPLMDPVCYGNDRFFVYLRLNGDSNSDIDASVELIKSSGQPVIVLELQDRYELGSEFFLWEFATAVTGAVLGVHPFNQPNVQAAKDATERVLQAYLTSGHLPSVAVGHSLKQLLAKATQGDYLAIMAYIRQTAETDRALIELCRKVVGTYHVVTTLGYGPRLLHSTGQLHKGGPNTGLFLQITAEHQNDIPVPGEPYTFGVLADAQALGDLQTLQSLGRRVIRVHLESGDATALSKLVHELG